MSVYGDANALIQNLELQQDLSKTVRTLNHAPKQLQSLLVAAEEKVEQLQEADNDQEAPESEAEKSVAELSEAIQEETGKFRTNKTADPEAR